MRIALLAVVVAALAAGNAGAASGPALRLVHAKPLRLAGTHFVSGERVRITVVSTGTETRRIVARSDGSFSVEFPDIVFGHCSGLSVSAVGSAGSKVMFKMPRPACMPARSPGGSGRTP